MNPDKCLAYRKAFPKDKKSICNKKYSQKSSAKQKRLEAERKRKEKPEVRDRIRYLANLPQNKLKRAEKQLERRRSDPEKSREIQRRYREKNPERVRMWKMRRRALENNAEGSFTPQELREKLAEYSGKCHWCGSLTDKPELDHLIPLSKGGSNWISNIVPSCVSCNRRKSNIMPEEFLARQFA
ncbi:HNH endonuclease [Deinococcus sp. JMULE3]|uniref:HNH endonuclease n=1 Tax=Deinococcus sp. JMULE3 TaxID=2518341 RepID=UPI001C2DB753|nr:HNH endonuclease [Deinococcus sp. JMULE3]